MQNFTGNVGTLDFKCREKPLQGIKKKKSQFGYCVKKGLQEGQTGKNINQETITIVQGKGEGALEQGGGSRINEKQ